MEFSEGFPYETTLFNLPFVRGQGFTVDNIYDKLSRHYPPEHDHMSHGQGCRVFLGDGRPPTFHDGILIMGPYKALRTWVDEFIPYYMEIMGVDRPDRTHG